MGTDPLRIRVFALGDLRLHCTNRWGHGTLDRRHALMKSCNPFFYNLGMEAGTNALAGAYRKMISDPPRAFAIRDTVPSSFSTVLKR